MHPLHPRRAVDKSTAKLTARGARRHNLRAVDAAFPLERLTVVTGVSGKSRLARDVLLANLQTVVGQRNARDAWIGCGAIDGGRELDRVLEVDQTPIGKTPRSCPATYVGFWDAIRRLYAETLEASTRGGGRIVAQCAPQELAKTPTPTGQALLDFNQRLLQPTAKTAAAPITTEYASAA